MCSEWGASSSREWIETNGIGGYASASVSGANTRRYHGLLIAATEPPLGRLVLLSKFEETLIVGDQRYELSTNQYPGNIHPEGYKYLTEFRLDPFPVWTFTVAGVVIERSLFMVYGDNTTVCRWKVTKSPKGKQVALEIKPLLAFRDHHHLRREDGGFLCDSEVGDGLVLLRPYESMPTLYLAHNAVDVVTQKQWYRNFEYAIEQERGFDFHEDLFQPFSLDFDLAPDAVVIASTETVSAADAEKYEKTERLRRADLVDDADASDDRTAALVRAADQFIVARGEGKTVIAGYPWFSDWGRDTMIALRGLMLAAGRPEFSQSILLEFAKHISKGMLPNRFPDAGEEPEYNTVDATLWFFEAIRAYTSFTDDYDMVRDELYDDLAEIIDWHVRGTRYGIRVDTDGLIYAGEAGVQLTWMDAKIGDWVVTPRTGKAVEIQALWYNALRIMADLAKRCGDAGGITEYSKMADIVRESFVGQFWNAHRGCLFDVINGDEKDGSVRPNQIFAVSLFHSMLGVEHSRSVVDRVAEELLTPVGLRSLSHRDERYVPVYIGSPYERDAGYHQGTVWGWLIGPFIDAYRKVHAHDADMIERIDEMIEPLLKHLDDAMLGQVSEIFDGDAPHTPRGCPAQAWSVAELLRICRVQQSLRKRAA